MLSENQPCAVMGRKEKRKWELEKRKRNVDRSHCTSPNHDSLKIGHVYPSHTQTLPVFPPNQMRWGGLERWTHLDRKLLGREYTTASSLSQELFFLLVLWTLLGCQSQCQSMKETKERPEGRDKHPSWRRIRISNHGYGFHKFHNNILGFTVKTILPKSTLGL